VTKLQLRTDGLTWREVAGDLIVLDLDRSVYLASNASGAVLWKALVQGSTRAELADLLVAMFGIAPASARVDVDDFVAHLSELGLLEP
jgi:hypothetical protein